MRKCLHGIGSTLSLATFLTVASAGASEHIRIVAFGPEAILDGLSTRRWYSPVLNDRGELAAHVQLAPSDGRPIVTSLAFSNGESLLEIARDGQPLPDAEGTFGGLGRGEPPPLHLNNQGKVAFTSASPLGRGIFYGNHQTLQQLFPTGDLDPVAVPDRVGIIGWPHSSLALNDAGQIAFWGTILPTIGEFDREGIFVASENGVDQRILQGDPVSGFELPVTRFIPAVSINAEGKIVIYASHGILSADSSSIEILADLSGVRARWFDAPAFNDSGQAAFVHGPNMLSLGGPDGLELIAERGSVLVGGIISDLGLPSLNNLDQVAFQADIQLGQSGDLVPGIVRASEGQLDAIVLGAGVHPNGGTLTSAGDPLINDRGQVAFRGRSDTSLRGIYFYDDKLGLQRVIQEGDEINGEVVDFVTARFPQGSSNLFGTGFNHFGQIAFQFETEDGDSGIAVWSPYPEGDVTADSVVDQGDLDLVLSSWGTAFEELSAAWQSNPPGALVDQAELDAVLGNWGTAVNLGRATRAVVPEPSGAVLLLFAAVAAVAVRRPLNASRCP